MLFKKAYSPPLCFSPGPFQGACFVLFCLYACVCIYFLLCPHRLLISLEDSNSSLTCCRLLEIVWSGFTLYSVWGVVPGDPTVCERVCAWQHEVSADMCKRTWSGENNTSRGKCQFCAAHPWLVHELMHITFLHCSSQYLVH